MNLYSLVDLKLKLDIVKLDIKNKNMAEYHETCIKHGLIKLADQIVDFLSQKPLQASRSVDPAVCGDWRSEKITGKAWWSQAAANAPKLDEFQQVTSCPSIFWGYSSKWHYLVYFPAKRGQSSPEATKVKAHNSVLYNVSPVFESVFNKNWNKSDQVMDDSLLVNFDQPKIFRLFINIIYELRQIITLFTEDVARVHFSIHEYQIESLMTKLRRVLTDRTEAGADMKPYTILELTESITMEWKKNEAERQKEKERV